MSTDKAPRSPAGLGPRGRRFWRDSVARYDFTDAELQLLTEACRTLDRLDALDALVAEQGATVKGSMGQTVLHPAIAEARQQRLVLGRLVKQLDLPDEDDTPASPETERARFAAQARWSQPRRGHG